MISIWMLHSLASAALVGLAALCLERVALALRLPSRAVWGVALAASLLLPLLPLGGLPAAGAGAASVGLGATEVMAVAAPAGAEAAPRLALERALAAGWALASLGVLGAVAASLVMLERRRRAWRTRVVAGRAVLLSDDTGPAVMGFLWPEVVVPRWVLGCDEASQRMLLEHEEEHRRAGDPHLLLAALGALILLPWNVPLWWQLRRLRLAIEVDCDARVLRRIPQPRAYGLLLLEVGRRASRVALPAAAFGEPRSQLERRIRRLTGPAGPGRRACLALGLAAAAALVVACELPGRSRPDLDLLLPSGPDPAQVPAVVEEAWRPTPTPYSVKPELINREEFGRLLEEAYPPLLRDAGIGGEVMMWVFISESGRVADARVSAGSGHPELDQVARSTMLRARFTPARLEEAPVPVWVQLPVTFRARGAPAESRVSLPITRSVQGAPAPASPTPLDAQPTLANAAEVGRLLDRLYPAALRGAGIGGTAVLWVHLDASGAVRETGVARTSGRAELDAAACETMALARFSPPRAAGRAVDAWIQIPVAFGG